MWEPNTSWRFKCGSTHHEVVILQNFMLLKGKDKLKTWNWSPFASNCGKWEAIFHDLVLWSFQIVEFNNKNDISNIKFKVVNWFLSLDSQRQKFSVTKLLSHGVLGLNVTVDHFHLQCNVLRTNLYLGKCLALNFFTTSTLKSFVST